MVEAELFTTAREAVRRGERQQARQLVDELVRRRPKHIELWLLQAAVASSRAERLAIISQALELNPDHSLAQRALYHTLNEQLEADPFLAYEGEDDALYRIVTADNVRVAVPKRRTPPAPFPPLERRPLDRAWRYLGLALVGLLPAGLGAVVLAPLALLAALRTLPSLATERYERRLVIFLSFALWVVGLLLAALFALHL